MKKFKVGIIGCGAIFPMHAISLSLCESTELVAVCDAYEPLLDRLRVEAEKASLNVTYYTNFDEFIQHDMDAVILANYATEHAPYAIRCLKAGKHVLSELMACETMAQAVELVEAVEQPLLFRARVFLTLKIMVERVEAAEVLQHLPDRTTHLLLTITTMTRRKSRMQTQKLLFPKVWKICSNLLTRHFPSGVQKTFCFGCP